METHDPNVKLSAVYLPSEKIIAREIEGEIIIVPIEGGVADIDDSLYSLNETGRIIWNLFDQNRPLETICEILCDEYGAPEKEIKADVIQLIAELLRLNIIKRV